MSFSKNERILCYHGNLLYEAVIQNVDTCPDSVNYKKYHVHYYGWKKHWDEWVVSDRMLKYSESNLKTQKELILIHRAKKKLKQNKRKGDNGGIGDHACFNTLTEGQNGSTSYANLSDNETTKSQDSTETVVLGDEEVKCGLMRSLEVPEVLKLHLLDDWDYITRQRKLLMLPSMRNVDQILEDFRLELKSGKFLRKTFYELMNEIILLSSQHADPDMDRFTTGLRNYFNVILGSTLLYKFERVQYSQILLRFPEESPTQIYGYIHLLRMVYTLGRQTSELGGNENLSSLTMADRKTLQAFVLKMLNYLASNSQKFFRVDDYGTTPPGYHRLAI